MSDMFTPYRAVSAEGARIALLTCRLCGAVVMLDPQDDSATALHERWHSKTAGKTIMELVRLIDEGRAAALKEGTDD